MWPQIEILMTNSLLLDAPCLIAHRGASAYTPENTLASFEALAGYRIDWVEFDVMLTSCGAPVVIHDHTLDRTTDGHGTVANTSLSEILSLDAGAWFSERFRGEKVPELSAVLERLSALNIRPNIELKPMLKKNVKRPSLKMQENSW